MDQRIFFHSTGRGVFFRHFLLFFCIYLFRSHAVDESERSAELLKVLERSAGVYRDPLINPSLKKTVIITGCNSGYLNFLRNFKCFTDRLNLKILVFSMDERVHTHILDQNDTALSSFLWIGNDVINEESAVFRSPQFNAITHAKTAYTLAVLKLGYDVLFIDTDIALIRDPMPYLIWKNVDYVFSHNKICPQ